MELKLEKKEMLLREIETRKLREEQERFRKQMKEEKDKERKEKEERIQHRLYMKGMWVRNDDQDLPPTSRGSSREDIIQTSREKEDEDRNWAFRTDLTQIERFHKQRKLDTANLLASLPNGGQDAQAILEGQLESLVVDMDQGGLDKEASGVIGEIKDFSDSEEEEEEEDNFEEEEELRRLALEKERREEESMDLMSLVDKESTGRSSKPKHIRTRHSSSSSSSSSSVSSLSPALRKLEEEVEFGEEEKVERDLKNQGLVGVIETEEELAAIQAFLFRST